MPASTSLNAGALCRTEGSPCSGKIHAPPCLRPAVLPVLRTPGKQTPVTWARSIKIIQPIIRPFHHPSPDAFFQVSSHSIMDVSITKQLEIGVAPSFLMVNCKGPLIVVPHLQKSIKFVLKHHHSTGVSSKSYVEVMHQ